MSVTTTMATGCAVTKERAGRGRGVGQAAGALRHRRGIVRNISVSQSVPERRGRLTRTPARNVDGASIEPIGKAVIESP